MSSRLTVKLVLFYGAMFAAAALLSLWGTREAIRANAEQTIIREMTVGSSIFDRIAAMQIEQLHRAGEVLGSDFGFRAAAATGDAPTIESALDSLAGRLKLNHAMFVAQDGTITGKPGGFTPRDRERLIAALNEGSETGIARWAGEPHMVAAAPVKAPMLIGWVVFARDMNMADLRALAQLSTADLHPRIEPLAQVPPNLRPIGGRVAAPVQMTADGERILVQARPVQNFGSGDAQLLVLEYSLTQAMQSYMPILWSLLVFGLLGLLVALCGVVIASRSLTRPILALAAAARRVSEGEHVEVPVETQDEIGLLASSFNTMVRDIATRERQIAHMAFHDGLTGLANRTLLREQLALSFQSGDRRGFALFCLDLDNFKSVNDTLGHPTGDALLCEVAARLSAACPTGFVARLGGDEFAIIVRRDGTSETMVARALIAALAEPFAVNGHRIVVGTSIGIARAPQDGEDGIALLKNADLALYRAKNDGKGSFRFFEAAMDAEAQERRSMEIDLHEALRNGELELYFQPLFGLSQNRVTAFEALLRWNHPTRGMVSPVDFIPLAEETGLILPIGEWVLHEACRAARTWPDHIRVAVNVSPVQFRSASLNSVILQALASSGLPPQQLELEVTESLFIENVEATLASLHSLRALGVRVALDDFGTGYSSLSYLRSFPFDKLKIDRSFIIDLQANNGATAMIKAITGLADALGIETTAEGVETIDQLDILRKQGCSQIQGFYFSRPIRAGAVADLIRELDYQEQAVQAA
ncbi:EAL domain-containing protein [Sphingomonas sp. BIUV-7]|uniref:EAL domain-containing protein n=1 Tax=Sphingomonas natans TaxID=3063330 RepID=A0ABT8YBW6_9SPHN|nr:EAL domain-containing protein [Sphingomonas sp. BIUV-7]